MTRHSLRAAVAAAVTCVFGWVHGALAAAPQPWEMGLQPAASPVMRMAADFHDLLLVIITVITLFVLALLVWVAVRYNAKRNPAPSRTSHNTLLEVAWTVVPVIILLVIAVPSFKLLYFMERTPPADMTVKVTGHQWYWEYEYPDHGGFSFLSNMIPPEDIKPDQRRLLEVDNRLVVPAGATVRVQVTATDVIHSWAVPSFGVKKDAVPGRLNEIWFRADAPGVYYGQCSQICGVNHGFMPIAVEAMPKEQFDAWVAKAKVAYGTPDAKHELAQAPEAGIRP